MICNRAEEYSIKVIVREERYTSVKSALDFGPFPNNGDKKENQVSSSGKRIRGLVDVARHCPYWVVACMGMTLSRIPFQT